jgi:hypothetical protein
VFDFLRSFWRPPATPPTPSSALTMLAARLRSSGVALLADAVVEHTHVMVAGRRVAIAIEQRDTPEGRVHAHIIAKVPGTPSGGPLAFDACVVGFGASVEAAIDQAIDTWFISAGAPLFSCVVRQPVLAADHFEGHEPWGVPGGHGFVGPFCVRDFGSTDHGIDMEALAVSNAFGFAGYPRDGKPHLVKAVLASEHGRWKRFLEIDGHELSHADEDWPLGIPAPEHPTVCFRFAIVYFPPTAASDTPDRTQAS